MKILPPDEAIPVLLDRALSPAVSLDTEFSGVPSRCTLNGLSMAGGTPETGLVGCFWAFGPDAETTPWAWLKSKVLEPIFSDPARVVVMHPLKVDMQVLRARDVAREPKCSLEDTMSMVHIFDENLPKGLKDLAECLLGVHDTTSYAATQKEIKGILKEGDKLVAQIVKACWDVYKEHRKSADAAAPVIDPTWPGWKQLVMTLPPKLKKTQVEEYVEPRIAQVVKADYKARAQRRFEKYGAEDALYTLGVRYFLSRSLPPSAAPLVSLETKTCHPIVTEMEEHGLQIDVNLLQQMLTATDAALVVQRADVIKRWGLDAAQLQVTEGDDEEAEFNPGSTDQIANIVWNVWKLKPPPWAQSHGELKPKWTRAKDGMCKVDRYVLEWLESNSTHGDDIKVLRSWRSFEKMRGSFMMKMLRLATEDPLKRIHSSFWPVGARSGRFTSDDMNVENIPRPHSMPEVPIPEGADPKAPPPGVVTDKDAKGKPIWRVCSLRKTFIAGPGRLLVSVDLSQIENRLMAHESKDERLLWIYRHWDCKECGKSGETNKPLHACPNCGAPDGKRDKSHPDQPAIKGFCLGFDIHAATSVAIGLDKEHGAAEGRQRAKAVNHAASYGMGANTLGQREHMSVKDAEAKLEAWHARYTRVRQLHAQVRDDIINFGYVRMFDGHVRRFFPQRLLVQSDNFHNWEWEGIIREGVNVKAQGGTAVIVKRAMCAVEEKVTARANKDAIWRDAWMVNQVHDEILGEAPEKIAKEFKALMSWELEHAVELDVPVIAEGGVAGNWLEAHA